MARDDTGKQSEPQRSAPATEAYAAGFFSAIISGPMVMPTEWLDRFSGAAAFETLGDLKSFADRLMERYNQIATWPHEDSQRFIDRTAALCSADESGAALLDWARGFLDAIDLRDREWKALADDPGRRDLFTPLVAMSDMTVQPLEARMASRQRIAHRSGSRARNNDCAHLGAVAPTTSRGTSGASANGDRAKEPQRKETARKALITETTCAN